MSGETAFDLGQETGRRFKESVIDQLEAIASKYGVRTASLSTGDYSYGSGVTAGASSVGGIEMPSAAQIGH